MLTLEPLKITPELDPNFQPASIWNRTFRKCVAESGNPQKLAIALERADGTVTVFDTAILPHEGDNISYNQRYVERLIKLLLWLKGGWKITIAGEPAIAEYLAEVYSPTGERSFDNLLIGNKIYDHDLLIENCVYEDCPKEQESSTPLGRNLDGCRIGFDLGGSDRKCAAVIDGKVVHSEEVVWDPYFEKNPQYHFDGIMDTLKRAAAHLPRVDAIGGSAAGDYINNEVKVASLFRGIPEELFESKVRRIFFDIQKEWNDVPFVVINDGEVTALAGSMSMEKNAVLGVAMGTSEAAGYVDPEGHITQWLNELAFVPVDYYEDAPADEWSGDLGCGAQYFSQQAVGRLIEPAGIEVPEGLSLPEKLVEVQKLMDAGDERAKKIYQTIGTYFGYAVMHYADFYEIENLLVLGRVTSGPGGDIIVENAKEVLRQEAPELAEKINLKIPGEKEKRHGQAVAAASLPSLQ